MDRIVLHVYYKGEAGKAKAFAEEMQHGLRAEVLAEDGCLQYDYFLPIGDEKGALLLEGWRDQAALSKHANGDVMKKLKAVKEKYGLETTIERYE